MTPVYAIFFTQLLPVVGLCTSLIFAISPLPKVREGMKDPKALRTISKIWVLMNILNSLVQGVYNIKLELWSALFACLISAGSSLLVLSILLVLQGQRSELFRCLALFFVVCVALWFCPLVVIASVVLVIACSNAALGPLDTLFHLVSTRNNCYFNSFMMSFAFLNNLSWGLYAAYFQAYPVLMASTLGIALIFLAWLARLANSRKLARNGLVMVVPAKLGRFYGRMALKTGLSAKPSHSMLVDNETYSDLPSFLVYSRMERPSHLKEPLIQVI